MFCCLFLCSFAPHYVAFVLLRSSCYIVIDDIAIHPRTDSPNDTTLYCLYRALLALLLKCLCFLIQERDVIFPLTAILLCFVLFHI